MYLYVARVLILNKKNGARPQDNAAICPFSYRYICREKYFTWTQIKIFLNKIYSKETSKPKFYARMKEDSQWG